MGTNFYVKPILCKYCGRSDDEIHLGKSSVGWKFMLQANGFEYYSNWLEMKGWLIDKEIFDEYGKWFALKDFIKWVENKQTEIEDASEFYNSGVKYIKGFKFYDGEFS